MNNVSDAPPLCWEVRRGMGYDDGGLWMDRVRDELLTRPDAPDRMLLAEFRPVVTIGRGGDGRHLRATPGELAAAGVDYRPAGRGGDVTWHGPGQLTVYPVLRLREGERDVHRYLRALEQGVIDWLAGHGIVAGRREGLSGVWVGRDKLAAVGVSFRRWITAHGLAVNVNTEPAELRRWIVPCGIAAAEGGVTSLAVLAGRAFDMDAEALSLARSLAAALGRRPVSRR